MADNEPFSVWLRVSTVSMVGMSCAEWLRPLCQATSARTWSWYTATLAVIPDVSMARRGPISTLSAPRPHASRRAPPIEDLAQTWRTALQHEGSALLAGHYQLDARRVVRQVRRHRGGPLD